MVRCFAALLVAAAIGLAGGALGQSNPTGVQQDYAPIVLPVACGGVAMSACAKVLPRIAVRAAQSGVNLKSAAGGIPSDTVTAVCDGHAAAAIVQHDAIALIGRQPPCLGRFDVVGQPLYPYYAFLIVRADLPFRQLDEMAGDKRRRVIMAGAEGTGGQITLGFLLRSNPVLKRSINIAMGDPDVGLQQVANGSIDGFFAVEPLDSDMISRARRITDNHGKRLYSFIDIRPPPEFFHTGDGAGHCLYRLTALDLGGSEAVTTVSLDAVMLIGRTFHDAHARGGPRAADALASAIDAAEIAILADTKSPPDWRAAGTSCQ
jgi:hypothetical protein